MTRTNRADASPAPFHTAQLQIRAAHRRLRMAQRYLQAQHARSVATLDASAPDEAARTRARAGVADHVGTAGGQLDAEIERLDAAYARLHAHAGNSD
jgi:hypothetical protein